MSATAAGMDPGITTYGPYEGLSLSGAGNGRWWYGGWNDHFTWRVGWCASTACSGHGNASDAVQHLRDWLLDCHTAYDGRLDKPKPCAACASPAHAFARVGWILGWDFPLCGDHLGREHVEELLGGIERVLR